MMKKNNVKKIHGVKVVTPVQRKDNRPMMPRPAVFRKKTNYNRNREKESVRKRIMDD